MCIVVFIWQADSRYSLVLLLNRDEYHNRPTKEVHWWEDGKTVGGKDEVGGGTWLAFSTNGKLAFLTNVLELHTLPHAKTRGDLPLRFLQAQRLKLNFKRMLDVYDEKICVKEMIEKLMRDTTKADKSKLPRICSTDWELELSSIFVEVDTPLGCYGTRSTTALTIEVGGKVSFYELYLENNMWKEQIVNYWIEKLQMQ
ncbi:hypothetical protein KY285_021714 [Solanum tuberosum]|nr:hypothetical protein KY285_021714 [Solanum tuberosum]